MEVAGSRVTVTLDSVPAVVAYSFDGGITFTDAASIIIPRSGPVSIVVRYGEADCTINLSTVIAPGPEIQLAVYSNCADGSRGAGRLCVEGGTAPYEVELSPELSVVSSAQASCGHFVRVAGSGLISQAWARITDAAGLVVEADFSVTTAPELELFLTRSSDTLTVLVSGGQPPYSYSFDGGQTFGATRMLDVAALSGPLTIVVRDALGCTIAEQVSITALETTSGGGEVRLFPNPARGQVRVENLGTNGAEILLFSAQGQLLRRVRSMRSSRLVDLSRLGSGIYTIVVVRQEGTVALPLLVE